MLVGKYLWSITKKILHYFWKLQFRQQKKWFYGNYYLYDIVIIL